MVLGNSIFYLLKGDYRLNGDGKGTSILHALHNALARHVSKAAC